MTITQIEIEKKFLVRILPETLSGYKKHEIIQAYIAIDDTTKTSTRIRKKDDHYIRTTKTPNPQGAGNIEIEEDVSQDVFETALTHSIGHVVIKTRYLIPYGTLLIELDIFHGNLSGLAMAEVEFGNENEMNTFTPPEWFGEDVTEDKRYANKNLCRFGIPKN